MPHVPPSTPSRAAPVASLSRLPLRAPEILCAGIVVLACAAVLGARRLRRQTKRGGQPLLLVINSSYSLRELRDRRAEHWATHRDLDGYFDHVWSVHPLVGANPSAPRETSIGATVLTSLADRHTMIEGKLGRFAGLSRVEYLNFVLAQAQLVLTLDRIVYRHSVDIVRADPFYGGLLALLLRKLNGCAVELRIVANHDEIYEQVGALAYPRMFRWRRVERQILRFTLSRADSVMAGSENNRGFALANGAREDRLAYSGNGSMINPIHLQPPRDREPIDDEFGLGDRPVAICLCRLERMKHPEDLVLSVASARARDPHIAGMLIGEGSMREELEALRSDLGLDGHVVITGERDQEWIARMLVRSAVVVAPHSGLALVESALSATPIAAYDYEWHAEMIRPGLTGMLVPYRDTYEMGIAICALVENRELSKRLGAAARELALEKMRPEILVGHERMLAERLLARRIDSPQ